jgi:hypothetical protein
MLPICVMLLYVVYHVFQWQCSSQIMCSSKKIINVIRIILEKNPSQIKTIQKVLQMKKSAFSTWAGQKCQFFTNIVYRDFLWVLSFFSLLMPHWKSPPFCLLSFIVWIHSGDNFCLFGPVVFERHCGSKMLSWVEACMENLSYQWNCNWVLVVPYKSVQYCLPIPILPKYSSVLWSISSYKTTA